MNLIQLTSWQACLKKTKVELEFLTDINIFLMVENRIRGISMSCSTQETANIRTIMILAKNLHNSNIET